MKQFGKILKFELKGYLRNKVFVGVTVFLVLLLAVVMFFPRAIAAFETEGGDDETESAQRTVMLVRSDTPERAQAAQSAFSAAFPDYEVRITDETAEKIEEHVIDGSAECAVVLTGETSYTYYVETLSLYDQTPEVVDGILQNLYRMNAMIGSGMTAEQAAGILSAPIEHRVESLGKDQMQNFFYTYIMIFALYMVILLYGQMVATNVASEKSSRAMELLITSAKPTAMMFGKVVASCLAGLLQLICVFGSATVFWAVNKTYWNGNAIIASVFDMPTQLLCYMLLFFVLGFFIYAFLYGAIGSTASKLEDINTSVMPVTLLFIIAFMVVMFSLASGNVDNIWMKICSYVPFTSSMAMFTRIAMSTVPWYEIVISVVILAASVVGVGVLSAKIYRVGVLLYGTKPKLGEILKAVWRA